MKGFIRIGGRRGAAMVELAVTMTAFLPMILIPLYLQDSINYKLIAQERVFSTVWDFAFGEYDKKSAGDLQGSILSENEEIFKNGKSGNKREKADRPSPWTDFRWPSNAVSCSQEKDFMKPGSGMGGIGGALGDITLPGQFHDQYTKGGLVECQGSIEVANYYVPSKIKMLTYKGDKDFFLKKGEFLAMNDGGKPFTFGVMVDPWTIHNPHDIEDGEGNDDFKERVNFCWGDALSGPASLTSMITFEAFEASWLLFMATAVSEKLLNPEDPTGTITEYPPRPMDISVIHPISKTYYRDTAWGLSQLYLSPYKDGKQNVFEQTYQARRFTYLGCQGSLDDGNC